MMTLPASLLTLALGLPGPPGRIIERVSCETDPTQTYALYLPSAYTPERRWPILFLMDPRGRALVPLELFQEGAERRGYILASSYDTSSDGPAGPNVTAMNAMLPDTQRRFSIDPRRLYLGGFSGTARISWEFVTHLSGHVAGIIGFGGGLPEGFALPPTAGFAFFGGAGASDFNYEEMRALDARLARTGWAHRFRSYDGPHSWGTEAVCAEALDWMEIRAMRAGVKERDGALVEAIASTWMDEALRLETRGDLFEAAARYRGIAQDLEGLRDTARAAAKADELARTKEARHAASLMEKEAARQKAYEARLSSFITRFSVSAPPPPLAESLADLQIPALKTQAAGEEEPLSALGAHRRLELVLVHTSFYLPRDFMERKDPGRALAILRIAAEIESGSPGICLGMARARAQIGQNAQALEDLKCLAAAPGIDPDFIDKDPWLAPLRGEAGYREILDRLRAAKATRE
jgi:predicted esterase